MKKTYRIPNMEIEVFDMRDTICTSTTIDVTRTEMKDATGELPPLPIGSINAPN